MPSLNRVMLMGNLGRDPEVRYQPSGDAVASFSIATNETVKDGAEKKVVTEWHDCVIFGKRAEVLAEYVKKGDPLYVEGKLRSRKWKDKSGNERTAKEVVIADFQFLGARNQPAGTTAGAYAAASGGRAAQPQGAPQGSEAQGAQRDRQPGEDEDKPF